MWRILTVTLTVRNLTTVKPAEDASSRSDTVQPPYNEGPRNWQNLFAITKFRYMEVLFHIFYYYGVKKIVRYTEDFVI